MAPKGTLTTEIIETIASSRNVEPAELDFAVQEYVDLDAVAQLAQSENSNWTLAFELPEQTVVISNHDHTLISCECTDGRWQPQTMTDTLGQCPVCGTAFQREQVGGGRIGYTLVTKGDSMSAIRCAGCQEEIIVPEPNSGKKR